MQKAASQGDTDRLRVLLKSGKPSLECLTAALEGGKFAAGVQLALAGGPAAFPAAGAAELLARLVEKDATDECCLLLDIVGVPAQTKTQSGRPVLVEAAERGNFELCRALLERGVDANEADDDGQTAVHYAAKAGNVEFVKTAVLYGAKDVANNNGETAASLAPPDMKQIAREVTRAPPAGAKAEVIAGKFKEQGNKVFADKEFVKAIKLYTVAVSHAPKNHVFYSNRSACFFNQGKYERALTDAVRCAALNPKWPKAYFRKGACLAGLNLPQEALKTYEEGLKIDGKNADLVKARTQILKDIKKLEQK
ncbi:Heat shock protein sti1-like protein [Diplonema papillatum]|nr:Heat shock protein sti1-like protein [Diplonema papillatum]KAJ9463990.1 Heat shock protein sti1-like protein [Diplonema papillatum]